MSLLTSACLFGGTTTAVIRKIFKIGKTMTVHTVQMPAQANRGVACIRSEIVHFKLC